MPTPASKPGRHRCAARRPPRQPGPPSKASSPKPLAYWKRTSISSSRRTWRGLRSVCRAGLVRTSRRVRLSNNNLDKAHALRASQMTALGKLGWSAPTGTREEILAKRQKGGSPNFFRTSTGQCRKPRCPGWPFARWQKCLKSRTRVSPLQGVRQEPASILIPTLGLKCESSEPPRKELSADTVKASESSS